MLQLNSGKNVVQHKCDSYYALQLRDLDHIILGPFPSSEILFIVTRKAILTPIWMRNRWAYRRLRSTIAASCGTNNVRFSSAFFHGLDSIWIDLVWLQSFFIRTMIPPISILVHRTYSSEVPSESSQQQTTGH